MEGFNMITIAPGNNSTVSNFFNLGLESNIPSVERKAIATLTIAAIGVVCVAISIISLVGVAIAIGAGVLTNVALSEGDIMMLDVEIKAVNVGSDVISFDLA